MKITKEKMIKIMTDHGMGTQDFDCFFEEFGNKELYRLLDIKRFLGY